MPLKLKQKNKQINEKNKFNLFYQFVFSFNCDNIPEQN